MITLDPRGVESSSYILWCSFWIVSFGIASEDCKDSNWIDVQNFVDCKTLIEKGSDACDVQTLTA